MNRKARLSALIMMLCFVVISTSSAIGTQGEEVDWATWVNNVNGTFLDSGITVAVSRNGGTTLINPDGSGSTTFTSWNQVAVAPANNSELNNIPVLNSEGLRVTSAGVYNFNLQSEVDSFYMIVTSLGSPSDTQRIEVTDANDNALDLTVVGTAANSARECTIETGNKVVRGDEANCVVRVDLQGQTTFKVSVLDNETYSVINVGIPAGSIGSVGPAPTAVPTLSEWSILLLILLMGFMGAKRKLA